MPAEIENVLLEFEGILDCIVFGEINALTGQMVSSKIVIERNIFRNNSEIEIKKLIKEFCKKRLDKFKIPAKIHIVNKIEVTKRFKKAIN